MLIHCGDLEKEKFLETLEATGKSIFAVKGNNYDYLINFKLPSKILFQMEGKVIGVCHGSGKYIEAVDNAKAIFREEKPDIVCCGHSHILNTDEEEDTLYINPGSFSKSRKGKNSCIKLKIDNKSCSFDIVYV